MGCQFKVKPLGIRSNGKDAKWLYYQFDMQLGHAMKHFGDIPYNSSDSSEVISSEEPLREHSVVAKYYAKECSLSDSSDASATFACSMGPSSSSISLLDSQNRTRTHTVMCQLFLYITFCCQYEMKRRLMISLQYCAA